MQDRFEYLPKTFDQMMLLPNVPDFRPSHRHATKVHQIITASCAFLKKEECDGTKRWTESLDATRRHINPPGGMTQHQVFFPLRGVLLGTINRKGIIAFTCNDDFGKTSIMEPLSQRLRDKPGVHGQGELGELKTFAMKLSFQTCEHGNSSIGFIRIVTPLFRTKE
jgi:hypothetical protein